MACCGQAYSLPLRCYARREWARLTLGLAPTTKVFFGCSGCIGWSGSFYRRPRLQEPIGCWDFFGTAHRSVPIASSARQDERRTEPTPHPQKAFPFFWPRHDALARQYDRSERSACSAASGSPFVVGASPRQFRGARRVAGTLGTYEARITRMITNEAAIHAPRSTIHASPRTRPLLLTLPHTLSARSRACVRRWRCRAARVPSA